MPVCLCLQKECFLTLAWTGILDKNLISYQCEAHQPKGHRHYGFFPMWFTQCYFKNIYQVLVHLDLVFMNSVHVWQAILPVPH